jgi:hypothetical protein
MIFDRELTIGAKSGLERGFGLVDAAAMWGEKLDTVERSMAMLPERRRNVRMRWVSGLLLVGAVVTLSLAVEDLRGGKSLSASGGASAPVDKGPKDAAQAGSRNFEAARGTAVAAAAAAAASAALKLQNHSPRHTTLAEANAKAGAKPVHNQVGERDIQAAEAHSLAAAKKKEADFEANVLAQREADKRHEEQRAAALKAEEKKMAEVEAARLKADHDGGATSTGTHGAMERILEAAHDDSRREEKEQKTIEAEKLEDSRHEVERSKQLAEEERRESRMQAERNREISSDVHRGDTGVSELEAKMKSAQASSESRENALDRKIAAERRLDAKHRAAHEAEIEQEGKAEVALQYQREAESKAARRSSVATTVNLSSARHQADESEARLDKAIERQKKEDALHEEARKKVLAQIEAKEQALQAKRTKDAKARTGGAGDDTRVRTEGEIKEEDEAHEKKRKVALDKELGRIKVMADKALKEAVHHPITVERERLGEVKKAAERRDEAFGKAVEGIRERDERHVKRLDAKAAERRKAVHADTAGLEKREANAEMMQMKEERDEVKAEQKIDSTAPIQQWPSGL